MEKYAWIAFLRSIYGGGRGLNWAVEGRGMSRRMDVPCEERRTEGGGLEGVGSVSS